jgi:hypothetical protein
MRPTPKGWFKVAWLQKNANGVVVLGVSDLNLGDRASRWASHPVRDWELEEPIAG